jgi:hypothetical protein
MMLHFPIMTVNVGLSRPTPPRPSGLWQAIRARLGRWLRRGAAAPVPRLTELDLVVASDSLLLHTAQRSQVGRPRPQGARRPS